MQQAAENEMLEITLQDEARPELRFIQRCFWFCLGLLVNTLGIALITRSGLGTSQISSLPYIWSLADQRISYAAATFVVNMAFVAIQIVLLGRSFFPGQLVQIVANVIFSSFLGLQMDLLSWYQPTFFPIQLLGCLLGCCILGCGIAIECAPSLTYVPGEGIVHALAQVSGKRLGSVKVIFDAVLVASAVALSLVLFGTLNGVGIGTVLTVFVTGNVVNFVNAHLPLIGKIRSLIEE